MSSSVHRGTDPAARNTSLDGGLLNITPEVRIEIHEMKSRYRTAYVTLRQIELAALGAPVEKRIITSKYPPAL